MNLLCYLFFITIKMTDYDSTTERDLKQGVYFSI